MRATSSFSGRRTSGTSYDEGVKLTDALLAVIAVLLLANLVVALNPPIVAKAKSVDAMDRVADALEKIANNGLDVEVEGEFGGNQPVIVKQVK